MMIQGKEEFITNIKRSLGISSKFDSRDYQSLFIGKGKEQAFQELARIKGRTRREKLELLDHLKEEAMPLKLSVTQMKNIAQASSAICQLIKNYSPYDENKNSVVIWESDLLNKLELSQTLRQADIPIFKTVLKDNSGKSMAEQRVEIRKHIIDSSIGITTADYCIAEASTLVMKTRAGQPRAVSLIPSLHICIIELDQLVANVEECYTLLKYDEREKQEGLTNVMTMISGPSKTADIELVMSYGAHGPRELNLFVITGY
jgi:L-lactate dehydrogenase complex protein LldG